MAERDPDDAAPRRDFLSVAIGGTAAALGVMSTYPVVRFLRPTVTPSARSVEAGEATKFPRGTAKTVLLGERPVLVIRQDDGSFRAFEALCTHLQCVLTYSDERKQIECPCHRGIYALDGRNVSGPPPRPLKPVGVAVVNGVVTVSEA